MDGIIGKIFLFIVTAPIVVMGIGLLVVITFFDQLGLYIIFFFYGLGLFSNRKNTKYIEYVVAGAIVTIISFLMNYFPIFEPEFLFSAVGKTGNNEPLDEMGKLLYDIFDFSSHSYGAANFFKGVLNTIFATLMIYMTKEYGEGAKVIENIPERDLL